MAVEEEATGVGHRPACACHENTPKGSGGVNSKISGLLVKLASTLEPQSRKQTL